MTAGRLAHSGGLTAAAAVLCAFAAGDPHAFDTGELVGAAFVLGASHPPGQPLHAILGHAATLLPLGPATFRVTLVSVAGALVTIWVAGWMSLSLARRIRQNETPGSVAVLLPLAVGFAVLVSPPVLRQATRPEVYTVALALFAGAALAFTLWAAGTVPGGAPLRVAAFMSGLAASLHPPHGLSALVVGLVVALACRRDVLSRPRALGWAASFFILGAAPLTLLPIRANAGAPMWGDPTTLGGFWAYVSAQAYRPNLGSGGVGLWEQVLSVIRYLPYAAGLVPLFGLLALARSTRNAAARDRRLVMALLAATVAAIAGALATPIDERIPDQVAYLGPSTLLLIAVGAAGMASLPRARFALVGVLAIFASVFALRDAPGTIDADAPVLAGASQSLTTSPPPRSLVIVTEDFSASTWVMARNVADERPDVAVLVSGLASSSWHWRSLSTHPAFDGTPRSAPGRTPWERYTRGAMEIAAGKVPIAVEIDEWSGGLGVIDGPYLVGDPRGEPDATSAAFDSRMASAVARLAANGGPGDHGIVHDLYRGYEARRARRLVLRRRTADGMQSLARALVNPSDAEAQALSRGVRVVDAARLVPVVPGDGPGLDRDATVRSAAVLLSAVGEAEAALDLLGPQAARDPRAILQAGWIAWADGRPDAAARALSDFDRQTSRRSPEAEALAQRLSP